MPFAILAGIAAGLFCGSINGFIVTVLNVNPIIATLGTLAAFDGLAFLIAPEGKPVGVVTQPDFTWLATGRILEFPAHPDLGGRPWPGVPIVFVILIVVTVLMHVVMRYTEFGRSVYAIGGNATAARLSGINLRNVRIAMYLISGAIAGLAGVLLSARTTSGNPINGRGLELQAITAVFLGGAASRWPGHHRRDVPRGPPGRRAHQRHEPARRGRLLSARRAGRPARRGGAVSQFRQARAERARTRIAAAT